MEEDLRKKKKTNTKKIILGSIIGILIGSLLSVSYAMFTYNRTGLNNKLIVGDIYMRYKEKSQSINFTNAMPSNTYVANQYFEFDIIGKNTNTTKDIIYDIVLAYGDNHETRTTRIRDDLLKFRLVTVDNDVETEIFNNQSYDSINNKRIHATTIPKNTTVESTTTYRLYAWISNDTIIGTGDDADYSQVEWEDVFASIKVNVTGDFNEKAVETKLNKIIEQLATNTNYVKNYTTDYINNSNYTYNNTRFDTQDTYLDRTRNEKQDVYYFTGSDAKENGNVLFAGYCWQIIRTTDTGGIKLIYNGVAENDKCLTTRTAGKGVNEETNNGIINVSSITNFGTGYIYDINSETFTLTGTNELVGKTWNNNSDELHGSYACSDNSTTCKTLWYMGHKANETDSYVIIYTIGNLSHYSQIGTSIYNMNITSPANVGYMYNKVYGSRERGKENSYYANSVNYSNGMYTLINPQSELASESSVGYKYVCDDTTTTSCEKVRYYFYSVSYTPTYSSSFYVLLENGDTNPIYAMLNGKTQNETINSNINVYNSAIKGYLDTWYKKNIETLNISVKGMIDTGAVYCNDRTSSNTFGSWNKDSSSLSTSLYFKQKNPNMDLRCENITDRFTTENNNTDAKLTYPVGLLTEPERGLMSSTYAVTGEKYWSISPSSSKFYSDEVCIVDATGNSGSDSVSSNNGVRPVITLIPSVEIEDGEGTLEKPYVIGEKINRTTN